VLADVRQGGILSPILFNVYVDNLIDELKNSVMAVTLVERFLVV